MVFNFIIFTPFIESGDNRDLICSLGPVEAKTRTRAEITAGDGECIKQNWQAACAKKRVERAKKNTTYLWADWCAGRVLSSWSFYGGVCNWRPWALPCGGESGHGTPLATRALGPSALARPLVLSDSEVDAAAAATCMPLCPAAGLLTTRAGIQVTTAF